MRSSSIAVLLAAAAALAGCGTTTSAGKFSGEQSNVAKAIDDYSSAAQGHDTGKICTQVLAAELAKKLSDCPRVISDQLNSADSFNLTVESVKLSGTGIGGAASARVKSTGNGKDRFDTLTLARGNDGRWRISGLG